MKKLTRDEMKNVKGGLQDPPPGCYCFTPAPGPGGPCGGLDPDCTCDPDAELYCLAGQALACC
jgi:hypothetical protein